MRTTHVFLLTLSLFLGFAINAAAQSPRAQKEIRYVTKSGKYNNSGRSWAEAKNNVQDAINDLVNKGLTGEVWVARGTYTPTESTEANGGSTLYMSFKVPAGITVRGGFFGPGEVPGSNEPDSLTYFRDLMFETCKIVGLKTGGKDGANENITSKDQINTGDWFPGETDINQRALYQSTVDGVTADKTYPYLSILSGDLSLPAKFEWNNVKKYWNASFYGNCFHVVWFATAGFNRTTGRANPLNTSLGEAVVEGFTIMNGNARNSDLNARPHNAYGGGVYMVQGSRLENCNVQQCEASRDGGGIYMDGGGVVSHCYINNCQALGIGSQNGYGGGVCLETNKDVTNTRMGMYRSVINGCVGRLGGGVAINTENATGPNGKDLRDQVFLSASAIYNNTATHEAGGLYMNGGGAVSNLTIVRNQCNGTGIISNGMALGRAGGLYCRDHATVFNSVLWGNECKANSDMQYASSQSTVSNDLKVDMRYCAVAFADYTDWSSTSKEGIFNISNYNTKTDAGANASERDLYPHFNTPTPEAGYIDIIPNGSTQTQTQLGLRRYYDWQPGANSCLANAGIIALDLNTEGNLPFTALYKDIIGNDYNPRATIGGYTRKFGTMTAQKVGDVYHFYVDPDFSTARDLNEGEQGNSWEHPARFISNVLYSIYNHPQKMYDGKKVYIHVKEGTLNNTNSYVYDKRVREMTIGVRSNNLEILGGYPARLTGTDKETTINEIVYKRDPLRYPTFVSGVITGENDYEMNAAHLMQFDNCKDVIFDGFQIRYANASSSIFDESGTDGGAIRLINGARNITFRNLVIAGNTADRGAAIFAEDGTQATFENVIIHNNEAGQSGNRQGIIHALGNAELTFNHCNILNNVGNPVYLEGTNETRYPNLKFYNTIFFANGREKLSEAYGSEAAANALPSFAGNNTNGISAYVCLFDAASGSFEQQLDATNKYNLSYTLNGEGFPRFVNGVHNVGVSIGGDETFYGRATSFEPHNENPMVNAAKLISGTTEGNTVTWNTSNTDLSTHITRNYGGLPDIGAIENHAATPEEAGENAYAGGQQPMGSVVYVRDYHTYETELDADGNIVHKLNAEGDRIITATDFSNTHADGTPRDGSSWENAINGNAEYHIGANGLQHAIDNAYYADGEAHPTYSYAGFQDTYKKNYSEAPGYQGSSIQALDRSGWTVSASSWCNDSETTGNHNDIKDGNTNTYWHSNWRSSDESHGSHRNNGGSLLSEVPEYLIIDLGEIKDDIVSIGYTPRKGVQKNGRLENYKVYISTTGFTGINAPANPDSEKRAALNILNGMTAAQSGSLPDNDSEQLIHFDSPQSGRYILILWCSSYGATGTPSPINRFANCAELNVYVTEDQTSTSPTYFVLENYGQRGWHIMEESELAKCSNTLNSQNLFTIESVDGNNYLRTLNGLYFTTTESGDKIQLTRSITSATAFTVEKTTSDNYTLFSFKNTSNNYLNCKDKNGLCYYSGNDNNSKWILKEVEVSGSAVRDIDVLYGPTDDNNKVFVESGGGAKRAEPCDVFVGAGTYTGSYFMRDGVSIYGGFPGEGNPGENERNISNKDANYMTILCGNPDKKYRILTQKQNFFKEAMVEGFIIKNGESISKEQGAGAKIMSNGILKNCHVKDNTYKTNSSTSGNSGGGGIYINSGGIVKNCIIEHNLADGRGGSVNICGAGVFANGGVLQNSLIVRNVARKTSNAILGAGLYISSTSQFYNCTVAYNFGNTKTEDMEQENPDGSQTTTGVTATGGVWDAGAVQVSGKKYRNYSTFYNCIFWGNYANGYTDENVIQVGLSGRSSGGGICYEAMLNCYSSAADPTLASDEVTENTVKDFGTNDANPNGSYPGDNDFLAFLDSCTDFQPFIGTWKTTDFSLKADAYGCINMGAYHDKLDSLSITEDIVGANRIIDCTVDKGAYEYYDSYAITPRVIYMKDAQGHDITDANGNKVIDEDKAATFYVTPEGRGLASGDSPKNAACAAKLQRVLDAAGRYKYQHPEQQIIVKIAQKENLKPEDTPFNYYATRTTDDENADVRIWSIIVPRGVEVWGGYSAYYKDDNDNGFYKNTVNTNGEVTKTEEQRDITGNPTYFNSTYYSSDLASNITTYHVVTFTDKVYDGDGLPYMAGDKIGEPSSYGKLTPASAETPQNEPVPASTSTYMLMSNGYAHNTTWGNVTDRAVIDGIFITGGQADLQSVSSGSTTVNINRYGGAAIVTDYAHVRNCIVRNNNGIFGGALALTHNALVSGCLIDRNTADYGGAIYVFEHGTRLSDGTVIDTENTDYRPESTIQEHRYDIEMPHVYSTTIVNNEAANQGGGVWYCPDHANVRFNSTLVWANACPDQPNVSGIYNITRPDGQTHVTTEFYPFNYCAVQDIRPSGLDNLSVEDLNKQGSRFHDEMNDPDNANRNLIAKEATGAAGFGKYESFGFYGLTNYSVLNRAGMPVSEWNNLNTTRNLNLRSEDFKGENRFYYDENLSTPRSNIEIGARAFDKHFPNEELMLRIFVARPEDVDIDAAYALIDVGSAASDTDDQADVKRYYAQEGSSFAHPMTRLQDALDYIRKMRGYIVNSSTVDTEILEEHHANDMPFEIYMGPGTFYPTADPTGNNKNTVGNTFVVPEGVSIVGGHNPFYAVDKYGNPLTNSDTDKHFLGRHRLPDYKTPAAGQWSDGAYYVDRNTIAPTEAATDPYEVEANGITYHIHHVDKDICGTSRQLADINSNSIVEPWELMNQTILSGQMEGVENNGVNHIVTIHADQTYVGALPHTQGKPLTAESNAYEPYERGQIIAFDGLTFTGGYAHGYQKLTVDNEHKIKYCYGGAILIDTNQYWNQYNKQRGDEGVTADNAKRDYKRSNEPASAGYREVPVMVSRCKFENNIAGLGGAISANTTIDVVNSSFEHNMALNGRDNIDYDVLDESGNKLRTEEFEMSYPGMGGAIYGTYQVSAINTLFANNEALNTDLTNLSGNAYAVFTTCINAIETTGNATAAPKHTILGGTGGAIAVSTGGHFHVMNCNFVRNQATAYPAIYTLNPNSNNNNPTNPNATTSTKKYNQAINCVFWGNAINDDAKTAYAGKLFEIDKIVNYGRANRSLTNDPYIGALRNGEPTPGNQAALDDEEQFAEQVWFSAYEKGKGKTPVNNIDLRDTDLNPRRPISGIIRQAVDTKAEEDGKEYDYQNCNVELASENAINEGPNFMNPSTVAGYEGYMESADWSPSRLNSLTDAGWGKIKQKIVVEGTGYKAEFVKYDGTTETVPSGRSEYSGETTGDYVTWGAYTTMRYLKGNEKYNKTMPLGAQEYMYTTYNDKEGEDGKPVNLYRISYDPNPTHNQTYIDIGVYEYHHTQLQYDTEKNENDDVDIIWVSPLEKPDNGLPDGSDWSQPTSDLQRAIETLLASRNGNRKEIRLMNGTFTPIYVIDSKYLTFYVNTGSLNTSVTEREDGKGIMSLTVKGGYSYELNGVRNVEEYPAIIRQQVRTDSDDSNHRWDHLFLIEDPTQRYGMSNYDADSDYGHWVNDDDEHKNIIHTFPIQFDGVTLINDNAAAGTKGAVIHYSDLIKGDENSVIANDADGKVLPTPANVTTSPENAATHTFDVIDSPAKLIISKSKIMGSGTHNFDNVENKDRSTSSAVYIGKNGGHALLYNNVMHTNYGDPLVSLTKAYTVNNTFALNGGIVNLGNDNNGNADAETNGSYIRNSVLWRNNLKADGSYGPQFGLYGFDYTLTSTVGTSTFVKANQTNLFSYNAFTGGDTLTLSYADGDGIHTNYYNAGLTDANEDLIYAPHFTDPENKDVEARDFSLQASLRLLQHGNDALYDTLKTNATTMKIEDKTPFYNVYDLAYEPSFTKDAGNRPRFVSTIDLGAYEYQNRLNRVFYVDPRQGKSDEQNGLSWEAGKVFGHGKLQNAVNLAALYRHVNNEEGYVFVKGGNTSTVDLHTGESLVLRDGVCIIGGINPGFLDECTATQNEYGELIYLTDDVRKFVDDIYNDNEGYIGPNTHKVIVSGIKTDPHTTYTTGNNAIFTLVDGFYVSATIDGVNNNGEISEPVINVAPQSEMATVILRDLVVYGNDLSKHPGKNVANVKNAMIYGSLFRDNKTHNNDTPDYPADDAAVLSLDENGWAVSITAEGKVQTKTKTKATGETTYSSPYNGYGTTMERKAEVENRIVYSIVNYDRQDPAFDTDTTLTAQTKYTLSGHNYRRTDHNLYYQLTEGSKHINEIGLKPAEEGNEFLTENGLGHWIRYANFRNGRDLLGNKRLLTLTDITEADKEDGIDAYLDRGAFETWRVEKDTRTTTEGHFTPHSGSVVYLMENVNFICGTDLMPGFLLLKKGASLYGNGHSVKSSFISVERMIDPEGNVMSLPFEMDYSAGQSFSDGVGIPTYADAPADDPTCPNGALKLTPDPGAKVYRYLGDARSEWNHEFRNDNSAAWEELTADAATAQMQKAGAIIVPANQGVFFKPSIPEEEKDNPQPKLYAFTSMGSLWNDNVYVEEPDENYKEVVLTQYDDHTSTTDDYGNTGADFTSQENMGWNCIGLPYLVSHYETHKTTYSNAGEYNMHLPHTLWLYYDGKVDADGNMLAPDGSETDGQGGFYSVPSWEYTESNEDGVTTNNWHLAAGQQPGIWWGEGLFVQTAAVSGSETLRFYRPVPPADLTGNGGSGSAMRRFYTVNIEMEEELKNDLKIGVRQRTAFVRGLAGGEHISIYDTAGRLLGTAVAAEQQGEWNFELPEPGIYIVRVDDQSAKFTAR